MTKGTAEMTSSERYRFKREAQGEKQVLLWIESGLTTILDELVESGNFRNRSEAVAAALKNLVHER
ncbi:ribbon-helix-helix domain-containing protein [Rhizobium leguminosarum]|uniref:ribbon-helix-helix domain-containing protein n=1 Tax=Rhizobium TaxID=379 RepID=UPI000E0ED419|nr:MULTISPECIES: ribbon-helix-helix domain-containing protein [Rhizobium]MDV4165986.1 ribbon-helix-helix domain-containing protein [Rhizobium leguminosarum]QIO77358.1 hypothetical protein HA459_36025 [Rhizobium leguminosarum bv. trifolii]QIO77423.1 hypothetical protein HA459_36510 [Rhizobium leguminosarum bv. trifolii]QIO84378.1 hypothetical protein HA460_36060 [Rhizobium leguminosarum bv. trifolii]QIO84442.1 hypothetical protein HA460_36545 [Rhizobium leguminosarum bv. trifolii]